MNEKLLSERINELTVLLHSYSVFVISKKGRIKVFPINDDGVISSLYPICQPAIETIIEFCRINELYYFVAVDVWTEVVCFTIYDRNEI